jgi:NADH-quinone oxidoreductase subunit A
MDGLDSVVVVIAVVVISLIMDGAILILSKILPKYTHNEIKISRYEAGNIPIKDPKSRIPMQYFGYMFMFMALEPVLVLILILAVTPTLSFFAILGVTALLFIPAIYSGYRITTSMAYFRGDADER